MEKTKKQEKQNKILFFIKIIVNINKFNRRNYIIKIKTTFF